MPQSCFARLSDDVLVEWRFAVFALLLPCLLVSYFVRVVSLFVCLLILGVCSFLVCLFCFMSFHCYSFYVFCVFLRSTCRASSPALVQAGLACLCLLLVGCLFVFGWLIACLTLCVCVFVCLFDCVCWFGQSAVGCSW